MIHSSPRLTVGLPVYNGENYLAKAIESVLAQTFSDFELVICDNASTDRTEEICKAYADKDKRIRYFRNASNLGAGPNYNRTFELASSTGYFRWLAHDDVLMPTYLERCVTALDADLAAVLCQSLIVNIDRDGNSINTYDSGLKTCRSASSPAERFGECILTHHRNSEVFSVIRRDILANSVKHGDYDNQDKAFVANMALRGRFLFIAEPLFGYRDHPQQFSRRLRVFDAFAWFRTDNDRWNRAAYLMLYLNYVRMVRRNIAERRERLRCYRHLVTWWFTATNFKVTALGLLAALAPNLFRLARSAVGTVIGEARRPLMSEFKSGG